MRARAEIWEEAGNNSAKPEVMIMLLLEVLLDIREILQGGGIPERG